VGVYSLNVPVPSEVAELATDLARALPAARARRRDEHTLVLKRLGTGDRAEFQRLAARARETLAGAPAVEVRVSGVDYFGDPASGPAPVVYLAVESPGLVDLHERLAAAFDPADGIEGDDYVPHVTVARGGSERAARELAGRAIEPVTWTVSELTFWDAERAQPAGTVSLPA
jgi:2'-5' RNA ligase